MVLRPIVILTLSTFVFHYISRSNQNHQYFQRTRLGYNHDIVALINDVVSRGINTVPHYRDNIEQLAEQKTV